MNRRIGLAGAVVLVLAALFAANIIAGRVLRPVRLDLTEGKQFTLTSGSKSIARSPAEPIDLTLYYSSKAAAGDPFTQAFAKRVREMLEEFARVSGGKVRVAFVDPEPFSEEEDKAMEAGVQPMQLQNGGRLYFGLVGTNSIDTREVIPQLNPAKERLLEYDIARMLSSLTKPEKPVIGWIGSLQLEGGYRIDHLSRQPVPTRIFQSILDLKSAYTVKRVAADAASIPDDIDILLVVHPKGVSETTQYAIDQFVLGGGRLLLFLDPLCEADNEDRFAEPSQKASNLPRLLHAWGVDMPEGQIVGDQDMAIRVMSNAGGQQEAVPFVVWLEANTERGLNRQDAVAGQVSRINLASAGSLHPYKPAEGAPARVAAIQPVITTTDRAGFVPADSLGIQADPKKIYAEFVPGKEVLTLAARLTGEVDTAFPDGPPKNADGSPAADAATQLKQSKGPINVMVFADADMLTDRMWMQDFGGLKMKLADNGDLLFACADNFSGSDDLIQVRARQETARPFTKVREIQRLAEQKYQAESVRIDTEIKETAQRISDLQRDRGGDATGSLLLSPEQQKELEGLRTKLVEARKRNREVAFNLRKDVEDLGVTLKLVNIALVPAAVVAVAVVVWGLRARERRRPA